MGRFHHQGRSLTTIVDDELRGRQDGGELLPPGHAQLYVDAVKMVLDGADREVQTLRYLLVALPIRRQ